MPLLILDAVIEQQIGAWIAFAALLFLIGCTLSYYLSRRVALREVERMRNELEQEVAAVAARAAEQKPAAAVAPAAPPAPKAAPQPAPAPKPAPAPPKEEGLSEELMLIIAAAVAAHLGKKVRVRHARLMQPTGVNPWAQQGRVIVQASHALALTHRD